MTIRNCGYSEIWRTKAAAESCGKLGLSVMALKYIVSISR